MSKNRSDVSMAIMLRTIELQIAQCLDWQKEDRDREGLETTDETHVIRFPVAPSRGTLKAWIELLQQARKRIAE